ncbi:hypothetical protein C2E20_3074 [Micractinium conductrix]|uniref:Uncharacterized protein n=1 Tax=Micractinium conductrix TaxID=554055 RepID=A0A2P6VHR7_9CHLO|nr:hypothetical protein C2E20_3074 [Micractinium conductrix]|eukprot:PSC73618.1 hypothetical protein C2E20_3074 [Micractinium conductrix]
MVQPAAASSDTVSLPDWREGPPAAVLEAIVWRTALCAAVERQATWTVTVQRHAAVDLPRLEPLRVAALDLRALTWAEQGGGAACESLLRSPSFQASSAPHLRSAVGVPERLAGILAAGFPRLEAVGLCSDYDSEGFGQAGGKGHLAPMALAPLAPLRALRALSLELGVADLAALPPGITSLTLMDVDRIVLPPAEGASVTDRLMEVVATAGLRSLTLQAASGCLVFEEPQKAPMELELSHAARLLAGGGSTNDPGWAVQLGLCNDGWRRVPQLGLSWRRAVPVAGQAATDALG